ncbi:hypothetical protein ABQ366_05290 [Serratia fonticola]|uniref:DUF6932 family protein n=1 Tax=Serratia fonticola TaxID=47917 RepID=UPI003AACB8EA
MEDLTTPLWNSMGIIPPIDESNPTSLVRSPYDMDIVRFVSIFAISPPRVKILRGFLSFRNELTMAGLVDGFQWVDGSFTENVELIERRPPNDVDVVTFFNFQPGDNDEIVYARNPNIFDQPLVKKQYLVDSYFEGLQAPGASLVARTVYWYSMWAHKRDLSWKGFIQIPLSPHLDTVAKSILDSNETEEAKNESQ